MPEVKAEYPYLIKYTSKGIILTPYIWIDVKTRFGVWRKQKLLFDTGADYTSFPRFLSTVVGVDLKTCRQDIMYTANNEPMVIYHSQILVRMSKIEFELPCVFTDKDDTPFLLGRVGIIDKFDIFLLAKDRRIVFERKLNKI